VQIPHSKQYSAFSLTSLGIIVKFVGSLATLVIWQATPFLAFEVAAGWSSFNREGVSDINFTNVNLFPRNLEIRSYETPISTAKTTQNKKVRKMGGIKLVLYGVGAVGSLIAKYLFQKQGIEIVGAIDVAKEKVGKDLGEILRISKHLGVVISDNPETVLTRVKPDIIVHTTSSYLKDVFPQLAELVNHGVNVVSTCEELSYPYYSETLLAEKLDSLAKEKGVTILGTGINPGFLMDTLVITLTAVCQRIDRIEVVRVMNAATRRVPFQSKVGAGLSLEGFRRAIEEKHITGHVGLGQSAAMIAAALAWKLDTVKVDPVTPVIAEKPVRSEAVEVRVGQVAGLKQVAKGYRKGAEVINLEFQAYVGAEEEYDSILIEGVPRVNQKITPCVHGDLGTVAMVVNAIPKVINASPGLMTMKDLPVPSAATENMVNYLH
jgi:hypothetical protein